MNPKMIMPLLIALLGAYFGIKIFSATPESKYLIWLLIGTFVSVFGWIMYFGDGSKRPNQNTLTPEERYEACKAIEAQIQQSEAASNQVLRAALAKLRA
jgi:Tfp pilus assembly protein PilO